MRFLECETAIFLKTLKNCIILTFSLVTLFLPLLFSSKASRQVSECCSYGPSKFGKDESTIKLRAKRSRIFLLQLADTTHRIFKIFSPKFEFLNLTWRKDVRRWDLLNKSLDLITVSLENSSSFSSLKFEKLN